MHNVFANITARGVKAQFNEAMASYPSVWQNHCTTIPSDAPDEEHAWLGMLPKPREFVSGRNFEGIHDFTYNVANKEYELSFVIDQNSIEDDRNGEINGKIANAAEVWASYKDDQFASLLESGATAGYTDFTGSVFFNDTHTAVGSSGTFDNSLTQNITTTTAPTVAEARLTLPLFINALHSFKDDQGRLSYNAAAFSNFRIIGHPQYQPTFTELANATLLNGGDDNVFYRGFYSFDPLPSLTAATVTIYATLCGANRKPFIFQERTPLQIEVLNDAASIAVNHGVMVLTRQRYRMWYGEPRRCCQNVYT